MKMYIFSTISLLAHTFILAMELSQEQSSHLPAILCEQLQQICINNTPTEFPSYANTRYVKKQMSDRAIQIEKLGPLFIKLRNDNLQNMVEELQKGDKEWLVTNLAYYPEYFFREAAGNDKQELLRLLITRDNFDINKKIPSTGYNALTLAASYRNVNIVKILLGRLDIDVNSEVCPGRDALFLAAQGKRDLKEQTEIIQNLLGTNKIGIHRAYQVMEHENVPNEIKQVIKAEIDKLKNKQS
jgi:hypothetical protein